jgi:hypothetical protein
MLTSTFEANEPCPDCGAEGKVNDNSPRRVLQLLGEEYLRQMIHVDALTIRARSDLETYMNAGTNVVVTDARNDNDRNNLQAWLGAKRVDVRTRVEKLTQAATWRQHASENRQPADKDVEHVLNNDEQWPFHGLAAKVDAMLVKLFP